MSTNSTAGDGRVSGPRLVARHHSTNALNHNDGDCEQADPAHSANEGATAKESGPLTRFFHSAMAVWNGTRDTTRPTKPHTDESGRRTTERDEKYHEQNSSTRQTMDRTSRALHATERVMNIQTTTMAADLPSVARPKRTLGRSKIIADDDGENDEEDDAAAPAAASSSAAAAASSTASRTRGAATAAAASKTLDIRAIAAVAAAAVKKIPLKPAAIALKAAAATKAASSTVTLLKKATTPVATPAALKTSPAAHLAESRAAAFAAARYSARDPQPAPRLTTEEKNERDRASREKVHVVPQQRQENGLGANVNPDRTLGNWGWGIDTMASLHVSGNKTLFRGLRKCAPLTIKVADGSTLTATEFGNIEIRLTTSNGSTILYKVENVFYHDRFTANLLSWQMLKKDGWELHSTPCQTAII